MWQLERCMLSLVLGIVVPDIKYIIAVEAVLTRAYTLLSRV